VAIGLVSYDAGTGRQLQTLQVKDQPNQEFIGWSPDGKYIFVRSSTYSGRGFFTKTDSRLFLLDVAQGRQIHIYEHVDGEIIWSPQGEDFLAMIKDLDTVEVYRTVFGWI
jgi:dipeptidyl aminopeptidase/acylaminoacyl peptidase